MVGNIMNDYFGYSKNQVAKDDAKSRVTNHEQIIMVPGDRKA
jgi:hypothetical protein